MDRSGDFRPPQGRLARDPMKARPILGGLHHCRARMYFPARIGIAIDHTMDHGIPDSTCFIDPGGDPIGISRNVPLGERREEKVPFASDHPPDEMLNEAG